MKYKKMSVAIFICMLLIVSFHYVNEYRTKNYLEKVKIDVASMAVTENSIDMKLTFDPPPPVLLKMNMIIISNSSMPVNVGSVSQNLSFVKRNWDELYFVFKKSSHNYSIRLKTIKDARVLQHPMYVYLTSGKYSVLPVNTFHSEVFILDK